MGGERCNNHTSKKSYYQPSVLLMLVFLVDAEVVLILLYLDKSCMINWRRIVFKTSSVAKLRQSSKKTFSFCVRHQASGADGVL